MTTVTSTAASTPSPNPSPDRPRVAVLGLGTMGAAMARRLIGADLPVTVWNRSIGRAEPFRDTPARVADDPEDAVADADVVLTMLFDGAAVRAVMDLALPRMARGSVWMQSSTVGVAATDQFADAADAAGVTYVDAPVLGTKGPAEQGTLTALVAGPPATVERLAPVLDAMAAKTVRVGGAAPLASGLKLAMNAWIATLTAGIAQSLTLARTLGVEPGLVLEALAGSGPDSPYAQLKGTAMLGGDFDPQFELAGLLKDVRLVRQAVPQPNALLAALEQTYASAADRGAADLDIAAVIRAFDQ
ncbi:NAD(P)-dependent oxidoreductase [Nakamurella flava]|nr:NAD(P)-dependent oxidoreductase [Nakamurella flava]